MSNAQTSNLTFGLRVGIGKAFLTDNMTMLGVSQSNWLSFNGGGFVDISLSKTWSIQPELLYTFEFYKQATNYQWVNKDGSPGEKFTINSKIGISSLRAPLFMKLKIGESKAGQIGFLGGPSFSYILFGKNYSTGPEPFNNVSDFTENVNHFQMGVSVGVDYRILDNLLIDVRYNHNFTNHFDYSTYHASFSNILVGVGYWL